jgi:hypothetical protein
MTKHQEIEYDNTLVTMLEVIWGEGFLLEEIVENEKEL